MSRSDFKTEYFERARTSSIALRESTHGMREGGIKMTFDLKKPRGLDLQQLGIEHCVDDGSNLADCNTIRLKLQCRTTESRDELHRDLLKRMEPWLRVRDADGDRRVYVDVIDPHPIPIVDIRQPVKDQHDAIDACVAIVRRLMQWFRKNYPAG